ncbi:MAG: thioredoxin domain-containing protein [Campylobacterota bacterium]|nr:thioredoxin domain-containing protein [Campylobacterota bacterium]
MIELTDTNYTAHVESYAGPIFIDFYSPMCGPCQEVLTQLPHLENYFKERAMIAKVNVTQNPKLAKKYEISSVPFCVSIGRDKMIKDYELGAASVDRYVRMIKKAEGKGFFARLFG